MKNKTITALKPKHMYGLTAIHLASEGKAPDEIELIKACVCDHEFYGKFEITNADLDLFVANYHNGVRAKGPGGEDNTLPINFAHRQELEAAGWITDVFHKGDGVLKAKVEWTDLGREALENKRYKNISPEWYFEYRDPETAITSSHVIAGAGLTNIPLFKKLKPLTSSEKSIKLFSETPMDIQELLKKQPSELNDAEKAYVKEHSSELTDEQKTTYKEVLESPNQPTQTNPSDKKDGEGEGETQTTQTTETTKTETTNASEGKKMIQVNAAEFAAIKKQADESTAQLQKMKFSEEVQGYVASESNRDGVLLPKHKDQVVNLLLSCSEPQRVELKKFIASLPKLGELYKAHGTDANSTSSATGTVQEKVETMAKEKMTKNTKLSFSEAVHEVLGENKELDEEYNKFLLTSA